MRTPTVVAISLTFTCLVSTHLSARPQSAPAAQAAPAALTPAEAAPLIGAWTIQTEGPNGPMSFALTLKVESAKVLGEISSAMTAAQAITDITKAGTTVTLRYVLDYQGNGVPTVISLTPGADASLTALFDFADGQFQMTGKAVKNKN